MLPLWSVIPAVHLSSKRPHEAIPQGWPNSCPLKTKYTELVLDPTVFDLCSQTSHLTCIYQDHIFPKRKVKCDTFGISQKWLFLTEAIQVTSWCVTTLSSWATVFSSVKEDFLALIGRYCPRRISLIQAEFESDSTPMSFLPPMAPIN